MQTKSIFSRWKLYFFRLENFVLSFYTKKNSKKLGSMHLKICSIILMPDEPLDITIHTGIEEIRLRAGSIAQKIKLVNVLRYSQELVHRKNINENEDDLEMLLAEKSSTEAKLIEIVSQKLQKEQIEPIIKISEGIKEKIMQSFFELKKNKEKASELALMLEEKLNFSESLESVSPISHKNKQQFVDKENSALRNSLKNSFEVMQSEKPNKLSISIEESHYQSFYEENPLYNEAHYDYTSNSHVKYKYLSVFENSIEKVLSPKKFRESLPGVSGIGKINTWMMLKNLIGKDVVAGVSVSIELHEPLSLLQRLAEQFEYVHLLEEADKAEDPGLRMAFVMAFAFSVNASSANRIKKPFTPVLGETFQFEDDKGRFKYFAEQICEKPSVTAIHCEGPVFEYKSTVKLESSFWGKSLEIKVLGPCHLFLKSHNEHILFYRNKTIVSNIIIGKLFIEHFGDMIFKNYKTNDIGVLSLSRNTNQQCGETKGFIKDENGKEKYILKGFWDSVLYATQSENGKEMCIWQKNEEMKGCEGFYNFSRFALQLNLLTRELFEKILESDSRFRKDIRALEIGYKEMAEREKLNLENKIKERKDIIKPRGFVKDVHEVTGEKQFIMMNKIEGEIDLY